MNSGIPSNPERQNQSQPVSNAQQSPKLLTQVRNKMRVLHYSIRTESAYVDWIVRFLRFHRTPDGTWRHPSELRGPEISAFLTYLAVDRQVSASTQNQALCAIVFLYRQVLELDPGRLDGVRARGPERLPVVLSHAEVRRILDACPQGSLGDSSAICFTAPGCDCWKFAGCESKTSTFNADRFLIATARAKKIAWFLSPNDALNRCGSRSRKLERCTRANSPLDMAPYGCLMRLPRSTLLRLGSFCGSSFFPPGESAQILDQEPSAGIMCTRIPCRNLSALLCCVRKLTRRSVATRFATVSRLICLSPGRISERCRNCWGIRM